MSQHHRIAAAAGLCFVLGLLIAELGQAVFGRGLGVGAIVMIVAVVAMTACMWTLWPWINRGPR